MALHKTQKAAAAALGVTPRSFRRYMQGTRKPSGGISSKMNGKVYRAYQSKNAYSYTTIHFDDGSKVTTRSRIRGNSKELKSSTKDMKLVRERMITSGEENGLEVTRIITRVKFLKA